MVYRSGWGGRFNELQRGVEKLPQNLLLGSLRFLQFFGSFWRFCMETGKILTFFVWKLNYFSRDIGRKSTKFHPSTLQKFDSSAFSKIPTSLDKGNSNSPRSAAAEASLSLYCFQSWCAVHHSPRIIMKHSGGGGELMIRPTDRTNERRGEYIFNNILATLCVTQARGTASAAGWRGYGSGKYSGCVGRHHRRRQRQARPGQHSPYERTLCRDYQFVEHRCLFLRTKFIRDMEILRIFWGVSQFRNDCVPFHIKNN